MCVFLCHRNNSHVQKCDFLSNEETQLPSDFSFDLYFHSWQKALIKFFPSSRTLSKFQVETLDSVGWYPNVLWLHVCTAPKLVLPGHHLASLCRASGPTGPCFISWPHVTQAWKSCAQDCSRFPSPFLFSRSYLNHRKQEVRRGSLVKGVWLVLLLHRELL